MYSKPHHNVGVLRQKLEEDLHAPEAALQGTGKSIIYRNPNNRRGTPSPITLECYNNLL